MNYEGDKVITTFIELPFCFEIAYEVFCVNEHTLQGSFESMT
jgi:hypothetical protein